MVVRAWRPASSKTATAMSEAPFMTWAWRVNSGPAGQQLPLLPDLPPGAAPAARRRALKLAS